MPSVNNRAPGDPKKILVVDDEEALVRLISIKLNLLGYEVTGATDPRAALKQFKASPRRWDMIITDMVMPGLSGAQLAEKMFKIRPDIPIVLCSGYSTLSAKEALALGFIKFLQKPLEFDALQDVVETVLDK